jgi:ADP-glucose pyrophosphorylase
MDKERFLEILNDSGNDGIIHGDKIFIGLKIISKYITNYALIQGAEHDIIYSIDVDELLDTDITEEDVVTLRKLNWFVEDNTYLAHFI